MPFFSCVIFTSRICCSLTIYPVLFWFSWIQRLFHGQKCSWIHQIWLQNMSGLFICKCKASLWGLFHESHSHDGVTFVFLPETHISFPDFSLTSPIHVACYFLKHIMNSSLKPHCDLLTAFSACVSAEFFTFKSFRQPVAADWRDKVWNVHCWASPNKEALSV